MEIGLVSTVSVEMPVRTLRVGRDSGCFLLYGDESAYADHGRMNLFDQRLAANDPRQRVVLVLAGLPLRPDLVQPVDVVDVAQHL